MPCDARVPVWGMARDGEKVTVTFAGQEISIDATNVPTPIGVAAALPDIRAENPQVRQNKFLSTVRKLWNRLGEATP